MFFNKTVRKHLVIILIGISLGALISYYLMFNDPEVRSLFSIVEIVLSACIGITIAYVNYAAVLKLDKLISWQNQTANRLLIGVLTHFFVGLSIAIGLFYLYDLIIASEITFSEVYKPMLIKLAILWFITVQLFSVIYFALYSYYSYSTLQVQRVKLERKQIDLQLNALKSQLSPHFLFNALNTISSLIYKDLNKAETFIRRLAKMYHYTLSSYHTKLISFQEELDFVNSYIYLQETRFPKVFKCKIDLPASINETKIPPLALQMLIENAVKHNLMSENDPLIVNVSFEDEHICVQNNITEEPRKVPSFKIGLKNISERYQLLFGKEISIANGQSFIVKIPVIR